MPIVVTPLTVSVSASGRYAVQSDVEDIFGEANVRIWSNLDNTDTDTNVARVQEALDWADGQIEAAFLQSRYTIPLVCNKPSDQIVRAWAAKLAGAWLQMSRGKSEETEDGKYSGVEDDARAEMRQYVCGALKLDAHVKWSYSPTGPMVVL